MNRSTILPSVGIVIGNIVYHIIVPLWLRADSSSLGVLLLSSISYICAFRVLLIPLPSKIRPSFTSFWRIGLYDALNGILLMYTSSIQRVNVLMQIILVVFSIVFSVWCNKYILGDTRDYNNEYVIYSFAYIFIGTAAMAVSASMINNNVEPVGKEEALLWILFYIIGVGCYTVYNTYQALFLREYPELHIGDIILALYYQSVMRLLFICLFFWVDLLPVLGYSDNPTESIHGIAALFRLSLDPTGVDFLYYILYVVSGLMCYIGAYYLNNVSVSINMMMLSVVTAIVVIYWIAYYHIASITVYLCTTISVIFIIRAVQLWSLFENKISEAEGQEHS